MRILIIGDMVTAIELAQVIMQHDGSSITIACDEELEALDLDYYDHILRNPSLQDIKDILC